MFTALIFILAIAIFFLENIVSRLRLPRLLMPENFELQDRTRMTDENINIIDEQICFIVLRYTYEAGCKSGGTGSASAKYMFIYIILFSLFLIGVVAKIRECSKACEPTRSI
ncbi:Protein of unknown function [Cotesia congregata]|uniref:Uncharacterized protein n=1 Tax=Cotesia congregata TaxID=51543 RepID=A0A8J2EAF1_COTCN|nr:Protein of unknown function [Cotesia congregata]